MLETIEELEREIDLFKQNIVSSNEMVDLLQNILNQIKAQNQLFDSQSNELMSKMEGIPEILEKANTDSNNIIQKDISKEIKKAVDSFSARQKIYIDTLEQVESQIKQFIEQSGIQVKSFKSDAESLTERVEKIPAKIEERNDANSKKINSDIHAEFADVLEKFKSQQDKYIESIHETTESINSCESELKNKYQEYLDTLEKTNVSAIYDISQQLKKQFSVKMTILTVVAVISVIVGIVGWFL